MQKYECLVCMYIYDPTEHNEVSFSDLPENWCCPLCGASKEQFIQIE